jgi:hypothetical protein
MRCEAGPIIQMVLLSMWGLALLVPSPPAHAQRRRGTTASGPQKTAASTPRFATGRSALKIPFDLLSNLIFVQVRVNDSRPLWFILDSTASSSVVNARAAKELGMRTRGKVRGTSGEGAIEAELVPGVSLKLPGVEVSGLTVAAIPLDAFAPVMGRPIGGIVGYDLISQFVVEIDYEQKTINLYAPAAYRYAGAGERLPVTFRDKKPLIEAWVTPEGRAAVKGRFEVATASSGALLLNRLFVEKHRILKTISNASLGNTGGVGGLTRTLVGRVRSIRVGRFDICAPAVSFSQGARGEQASAAYDGVLGGEVFRRFKVILDYTRGQIYLDPNAHLPEAVEEDMSGLELVAEGEDFGTYVINEIIPNSPGAEAGLREEDELTDIDGRPVTELGLEGIRQMFRQEGKEHLLNIKRGGQKLQVKVKLRRLR